MFKTSRRAAIAALAVSSLAAKAAFAADDQQDEEFDAGRAHARPAGAVFAMSNVTAANRIFVYRRADDGQLTLVRSVRTRGLGIGVDTDTQGPLRLSADARYLYACNPGSDDVSVFAVSPRGIVVGGLPVADGASGLASY